jgi:hypothetical protein
VPWSEERPGLQTLGKKGVHSSRASGLGTDPVWGQADPDSSHYPVCLGTGGVVKVCATLTLGTLIALISKVGPWLFVRIQGDADDTGITEHHNSQRCWSL